jgi:uncharacterized protein YbjT (DUF2867 family)
MYVVAGVSGNVGSVVADELLKQGKPVRVIVRDKAKGAPWAARGAAVAVASLDDTAALTAALQGATGFFTLIPPSVAQPDFLAYQRRVSDATASAVKASHVQHVVLLSSVGADLPDNTGPIKGLHYLENAVRATGAKVTALRAGYFQENLATGLGPAREHGVYYSLIGTPGYPFPRVATGDIGKAAAEALLTPPAKSQVIDIHGPSSSEMDLIEKLGKALGKPVQLVTVPPEGRVAALTQAGLPADLAALYAEMLAGFDKGAIVPRGDRLVQGTTTLEETIAKLVR